MTQQIALFHNRNLCIARLSLAALGVLLLSGCAVPGSWQTATDEAPLAAPGAQAKTMWREIKPICIPFGIPSKEVRWQSPTGQHIDLFDAEIAVDKYLIDAGLVTAWPETNRYHSSIRMRLAPYRFTIVSVFPTVVLMKPHRYSSPKTFSASELASSRNGPALYSRVLVNHFEYGASGDYSEGMLWFSPDLKRGPEAVERVAPERLKVPLPDGAIEIMVADGLWHATRIGEP